MMKQMFKVEDRLDIQELVVRYGFLVDDRRWNDMGDVFTPDAVVDFGDFGRMAGLDNIVSRFRAATHPLQHVIANHLIDRVNDDEAIVFSKALFPVPGDGVFEGVYRDVVVRTPDGWRIKYKTINNYGGQYSPWANENYKV